MVPFTFAVIALTALSGYTRAEQCYCTEQYDPVCASNGQIFSNLCMLRCHNINNNDNLQVGEFDRCSQQLALAAFGPFQGSNCFSLCPHTPLPVCGSDGIVYGSSCALNCMKQIHENKRDVVVVHEGPCHSKFQVPQPASNCFSLCPHTPLPVCGSDGIVYGSSCALNCMKQIHENKRDVVVVHEGPCHYKTQAL